MGINQFSKTAFAFFLLAFASLVHANKGGLPDSASQVKKEESDDDNHAFDPYKGIELKDHPQLPAILAGRIAGRTASLGSFGNQVKSGVTTVDSYLRNVQRLSDVTIQMLKEPNSCVSQRLASRALVLDLPMIEETRRGLAAYKQTLLMVDSEGLKRDLTTRYLEGSPGIPSQWVPENQSYINPDFEQGETYIGTQIDMLRILGKWEIVPSTGVMDPDTNDPSFLLSINDAVAAANAIPKGGEGVVSFSRPNKNGSASEKISLRINDRSRAAIMARLSALQSVIRMSVSVNPKFENAAVKSVLEAPKGNGQIIPMAALGYGQTTAHIDLARMTTANTILEEILAVTQMPCTANMLPEGSASEAELVKSGDGKPQAAPHLLEKPATGQ